MTASAGTRLRKLLGCAASGNLGWAFGNYARGLAGKPRVLLPRPVSSMEEASARRINAILTGLGRKESYLEIGVEYGRTLESVHATRRVGVDPFPRFDTNKLPVGLSVAICTSDDFFASLADSEQFDLIFLDGLHTFKQTYRDLIEALRHCRRGVILLDDVIPCDSASAIPDYEAAVAECRRLGLARNPLIWHGDVYKVLLCVARLHPELDFRTINGSQPQAVLWKKAPGTSTAVDVAVSREASALVEELDATGFEDVFSCGGIPSELRPTSEREAIADALEGIRLSGQSLGPL